MAGTSAASVHVLTPAYYERLALLEREHWWWRGMRAIAAALLDGLSLPRTARVLDAGCGTGMTLDWIARVTDVPPVGLDRAPEALVFCREAGHRRLMGGDATALPIADARFELALSLDVIQHLPRPGGDLSALRELRRALAPGGHLLLRTNSRCGYPPDSDAEYHRYSVEEARDLIERAGLTVVRATYVNCAPAVAITAIRRIRRSGPGASDPGLPARSQGPGFQQSLAYAALRAEALFLRYGRGRLPFGHSIVALARRSD
jgi:SAM-dependent methyltransferase